MIMTPFARNAMAANAQGDFFLARFGITLKLLGMRRENRRKSDNQDRK